MPENPHAEHLQELLEGLNEPQREAVTHGEGPLLILAGAGSGKTRVLAHRIAFLIYTDQAQAGEILAITFTNKAAKEMRERVERLLGRGTRGMWLMTFHAACARILRAEAAAPRLHAPVHDLRPGRRAPADQALAPTRSASTPSASRRPRSTTRSRPRRTSCSTPSAYRAGGRLAVRGDGRRRLRHLRARPASHERDGLRRPAVPRRSTCWSCSRRSASATRDASATCSSTSTRTPTTRSTGCCSCSSGAGARRSAAQAQPGDRPTYAGPVGHRNLAVVGDDAQSIYSFRGADVRNILDFQEDFPDARVVKLEQNYRSTETILQAANAVIANNRGGIAKRLWSELGQGDQIQLRALEDEHAEARFVVGEIERLVDEGASRAEIAVLYRTNAMSRVIEDTLVRREIAYQVIGGTKFYERAEIKDAIAYLSLLANPFDVVSFTRVANSPRRGIGQTSLARVLAHADALGISVWEAASRARARSPASAPPRSRRCGASWTRWRSCARSRACPDGGTARRRAGAEAVRAAARRRPARGGALADRLRRGARGRAHDRGAGTDREPRAARRGRARVRRRGAPEGEDTLDVFLQEIALVADADARSDDEGLVTLMTLHNAKGLEYPIVFIAGCEDGVFPHSRALDEGGARGGAASVLRRRDARDARALPDLRAPARGVRRAELRPAQPLPRRDPRGPARRAAASTLLRPGALVGRRREPSRPRGLRRRQLGQGPGDLGRSRSAGARARRSPASGTSASARTSSTPPSATASSPASSRAG